MLHYESIYAVNMAWSRLLRKHDSYGWSKDNSRESDKMIVFTLGDQATRESQENLDHLLALGKKFNQKYLVFTDRKIQFVGEAFYSIDGLKQELDPKTWRQKFEQWRQVTGVGRVRFNDERSAQGTLCWIYTWKHCWAITKHQGVYDIETGKKLTKRREIIQKFWDLGFASQRGRPLSVATIASTGERDELEEITQRAQHYYYKRGFSEAARKIIANFTSINRRAAWPGAW